MSDLVLRPYRPEDIPAVTKIYGHYVRETVITFETEMPSETEMAERFGKLKALGHPLIIAERAGEVMGYAYASFYRPRAAYRFTCENSIYLSKDVVGQGIGGRLLEALLDQCRTAGFKQMIAVITAERANSIRLHEKLGFRKVAHYEAVGFKFDRWLDIVHMQRAI